MKFASIPCVLLLIGVSFSTGGVAAYPNLRRLQEPQCFDVLDSTGEPECKTRNGQCVPLTKCNESVADCFPELCRPESKHTTAPTCVCEIPRQCFDNGCAAAGGRCVEDCDCADPHVCVCREELCRPNPLLDKKCSCQIDFPTHAPVASPVVTHSPTAQPVAKVTHSPTVRPVASPTGHCSDNDGKECQARNGQCVEKCDESHADCIPELCNGGFVFEKSECTCEIQRPCVDYGCTAKGGRCVPDCQCDDPHVCSCVEDLCRPNPAFESPTDSKCLCRIPNESKN